MYSDYRKVLDRKDIDAIIVGTPDHWHALVLIHACEAGKDAYCEKPISHDIVEAVNMAGAVKHHNRIVQCGTWQRSTKEFTDALAYVRAGKLGKINVCRPAQSWPITISRGGSRLQPHALRAGLPDLR